MLIVIMITGMTSCKKKDDGKITSEQVEAAYRDAGYAVASSNAYNSSIDGKSLEKVWQVGKNVGDDNVAGKIYVFSNSTAQQAYWEAWRATYPNNFHEFTSHSVQNVLLTEISVNGVMCTTQLGGSGPKLGDDLVKGLTGVLSSIKY